MPHNASCSLMRPIMHCAHHSLCCAALLTSNVSTQLNATQLIYIEYVMHACMTCMHTHIHTQIPTNKTQVNDGLDTLLQIVAQHRKRDPEGSAEQECVQNLFLCLCTALMDTDNQNNFRTCEGIELMIRFLKENKYAATCAGRAITYAVSNNR